MRAGQQRPGARQHQQAIDWRLREESATDQRQANERSCGEDGQTQVERDVDPGGPTERLAVDDGNPIGVGLDPLTVTLDRLDRAPEAQPVQVNPFAFRERPLRTA
jgi:hypothetical protein